MNSQRGWANTGDLSRTARGPAPVLTQTFTFGPAAAKKRPLVADDSVTTRALVKRMMVGDVEIPRMDWADGVLPLAGIGERPMAQKTGSLALRRTGVHSRGCYRRGPCIRG